MKITIEFFKDSKTHPLINGNYGILISEEGKPDIVIAGSDSSKRENKSIDYLVYALRDYMHRMLPKIKNEIKSLDDD